MKKKRKACSGKVRHKTEGAAKIALANLNNAGLRAYECSFCQYWHIGNSNQQAYVIARIDQLLGIKKVK